MAHAQVTISVTTDRQQYVQYEPILATVTVKNYSGNTLSFGTHRDDNSAFMTVEIRDLKNPLLPLANKEFNPVEGLVLSTGVVKTLQFAVSDYYPIQAPDDYELVVRIGHGRLSSDFLSAPVRFQVRAGMTLWQRLVGMPDGESNQMIAARTCEVKVAHIDDADMYILQIEDADYVYSVIRLGPRVHGILPQFDVDALSRIHTLTQTQPRIFSYRIFDLTGTCKQAAQYTVDATYPQLIHDSDVGTVTVVGGRMVIASGGSGSGFGSPPAAVAPQEKPEPAPKPRKRFWQREKKP